jgi:LPPG:FO 2-phospho-L-lactate transferase
MLRAGWSLTDITAALCARWRPGVHLVPMSDDPVETHVVVHDDEGDRQALHIQEWLVREQAARPAHEFIFLGAAEAKPTPAAIAAISEADVVLLPPSNPVVSIGAILQVAGIGDALRSAQAPIVGVSPVIGGAPVRGMAGPCLAAIGVETTASAVAHHYGARLAGGLLDGWLVDDVDARGTAPGGVVQRSRPLLMRDPAAAAGIAGAALDLAIERRRS